MDEVLDSMDIVVMEGMNRDLQWTLIGEEVRKGLFSDAFVKVSGFGWDVAVDTAFCTPYNLGLIP